MSIVTSFFFIVVFSNIKIRHLVHKATELVSIKSAKEIKYDTTVANKKVHQTMAVGKRKSYMDPCRSPWMMPLPKSITEMNNRSGNQ